MSESKKQGGAKKKVRYVPSRYKSAAEKISSQSSVSNEKSTFLRSGSSQGSGYVSQSISSGLKHSACSDSRGKTSTPTSAGKLSLMSLDASVIASADGHVAVPHLKERIGPLSADSVKRNLTKNYRAPSEMQQSCMPLIVTSKGKKENDGYVQNIAEAEMDLLYANYLQAAFLESEAKKALQARSSSTLITLHRLFTLLQQYLFILKSKASTLKLISSLIQIHEHCKKQEAILKPVFEMLPLLKEQYSSLAEAVNSSKHKLHVKDVILPEPGCEGDIIDIIKKMDEFLNRFFELYPNYNSIISSSDALKRYVDAGELLAEALKRGLDLIIEAKDLSISEASLALSCENL